MKNYTAAAAAALIAVAALTGCGGTGNTVTSGPAPAAAPAPASTAPGVAKFGETVTFPNGVSVTVKPAVVAAAPYAAGAVEGKIVTFDISVTNGSKEPLNGALMGFPKVTYGAQGTAAESAIDSSAGIGGTLSTILPGETQTAKTGAGIPSAAFGDVRVQITGPTFNDQPAIFKGAVQ